MKKIYEAPSIEKIAFQYRDQVVVASGDMPIGKYYDPNETGDCTLLDNDKVEV